MTTVVGRDGRPLVTAAEAAYKLGWTAKATGRFRTWASRHGVRSKATRWRSGPGRSEALYDLADIDAAFYETPRQREPSGSVQARQVDVS